MRACPSRGCECCKGLWCFLEKAACQVLGLSAPQCQAQGSWGTFVAQLIPHVLLRMWLSCLESVFTAQPGGTFKRVHPLSHSLPVFLEDSSVLAAPRPRNLVAFLTSAFLPSANPAGSPLGHVLVLESPRPPPCALSPGSRRNLSPLPASRQAFPQPNLCSANRAILLKAKSNLLPTLLKFFLDFALLLD